LGCLPRWGREEVTLAISTTAQKTRGEFYKAGKITIFKEFCHPEYGKIRIMKNPGGGMPSEERNETKN
jgi:hypothetical protein